MSIELVMLSNNLTLCCPLLLLPSIFPSIRVLFNEPVPYIRWPKYWSFSISINPSNEYSGLIFFRTDWFELLAVQRTLKSSTTPQFKNIHSLAVSFLYGPTLTPIWFRSNAQSCPILCDPMDCNTPGFPVHHQLPEIAQTHVRQIGDALQPSHHLPYP